VNIPTGYSGQVLLEMATPGPDGKPDEISKTRYCFMHPSAAR